MLNKINDIREHYRIVTPDIVERSLKDPSSWVTPYGYIHNWVGMMSPIEYQAWQAIRCFGKVPLYPQYPVGKYFLDFGNPVLRIGLECDGREFHQDKAKDRNRDTDLWSEKWKIYRIPGSDCNKLVSDEYYNIGHKYNSDKVFEILKEYYQTIEGLLKALAVYYCGYTCFYDDPDELSLVRKCLADRISLKDKIRHINI